MTVCNMSIEAGARAGMIAPDDTTFAYLEGRPGAPKGADWERGARRAGARCRPTPTRPSTASVEIDVARARAAGHLGHEPGHGRAVDGARARSRPTFDDPDERDGGRARARLHGPRAGHADRGHPRRPRLHRLVHERADRGPARGGRGRRGQRVHPTRARDGRAGLGAGEAAGRGGGARPRLRRAPASSGAAPAARCASA